MKTFTAVVQVSWNRFEVEKIEAETFSRVRATTGILIAIYESNTHSDQYCTNLAAQMTKELQNA